MRKGRLKSLAGWGGLALALAAAGAHPAWALEVVGTISLNNRVVKDVAVSGTHAYLAGAMGFAVVDVSDPSQPQLRGALAEPASGLGVFVAPEGDLAYLAAGSAGLRVIDVSDPEELVELGVLLGFDEA